MDPRRDTLLATSAIILVNVGFVALCIAAGWPEWWKNINYEASPLTWFSSVQLMGLAAVCGVNAALSRLPLATIVEPRRQRKLWTVLGLAFGYLSADERFQLHERLREGIFKPHNIGTDLPGIGPGDFLLIVYAIAGLAVVWFLWRYVTSDRAWLAAAVAAALLAVALDAADFGERSLMFHRTEQFIEELLETAGQMFFLVTFSRRAIRVLSEVRIVPP